MAAITFDISKGREVEFYNRVLTQDPASAAFIVMVLAQGSNDINDLFAMETFDEILTGGFDEVTNTGYARETLTDLDLSLWFPSGHQTLLTLPLMTFSSIASGDIWDIAVVGYDSDILDSTGGVDVGIIPVTAHELRIDGSPIPGVGDDIVIDLSGGWALAA